MEENPEIRELRRTIQALEAQRNSLGDAVVDTSISALRGKLAELQREWKPDEQLRRNATVLFADVSGFTSICRVNDAENVTEAINSLWQSLDSIIISFGGTVDKHIGDCVMAVWGIQGVREDDPVRAVNAALSMQEASSAISGDSRGLIPPFRIRIGVHTGPVFMSRVGLGNEFTVIGDTVNIASRLQNIAPLGSVLITRSTWKSLHGRFQCAEQPPVNVRGITDEIHTWLVTGRAPGRYMGLNTSILGLETGMVGRQKELRELAEQFTGIIDNGGTRMVTVTGEAGIGKSRLLHEFRCSIEDADQIIFFNARCTPGMEDMPCSMFRDVLRFSFGVLESDSSETAIEKLLGGMTRFIPPEDAVLACFYAGFDISSSRFKPGNDSASGGKSALLSFFRKASLSNPVLLYLEDIHWADPVSLDLALELVSWNPGGSLLAVCLARPPLFERKPDWGKGLPGALISLMPLSKEECGVMTETILSSLDVLPEELMSLITMNADGNPFYVEELIKMLAEDGVIDIGNRRVNTEALTGIGVPGTLTGVLQARLDSLAAEERKTLQMASVVGRVFWDMTVGDLAGGSDLSGIEVHLSSAERRDLVHRMEQSTFLNSGEYLFKHAILRDVTYETVLLKARRKYHRLVARWLLKNAGDRISEFQGIVASHFEAGEEWPEALKWLRLAGDSAVNTSGYFEAVSIFTRALSIPAEYLESETTTELLVKRGVSLEKLSEYCRAEEDLQRAVEIAEELSLHRWKAEALSTLTWICVVTGRKDLAREFAFRALDSAEISGEKDLLAKVHMRMADFEEDKTYGKVLAYFSRALDIFSETGNVSGAATALLNMGNIALAFKEPDDAERYYSSSLEKYTEIGSRWGIANCLANLGCVASVRKEFSRAVDCYSKSLEVSRSIGDREGEAICNLNLADAALALRNPEKALVHSAASARISESAGIRPILLAALRSRAEAFIQLGEFGRASAALPVIARDPALDQEEKDRIEMLLEDLAPYANTALTAIDELVNEILANDGV